MKPTKEVPASVPVQSISQGNDVLARAPACDFWRDAENRYRQAKMLMDDMYWMAPPVSDGG